LQSDAFTETIPQNHLPPHSWGLRESLQFLHHPAPDVSLGELEDRSHPAWQRLKAEELLAQQLSQLQAKRERQLLNAPVLAHSRQTDGVLAQLHAVLPFKLTGAQQRVVNEIANDVARAVPMHRLLQGDVGSGKTVVAALAAAQCIDAGWQCALMAPTEILAEQHFAKLIGWLAPVLQPLGLQVAWLTGSQKKKERDSMLAMVESGEAALVVGTHTHVPTADARILKKGTGFITDVGMCGPYDSVIGRDADAVVRHMTTALPVHYEMGQHDSRVCGVFVEVSEDTGLANRIERIELSDR